LARVLNGRFGNIRTQAHLLKRARGIDAIYAPSPQPLRLVSRSRLLRLRTPLLLVQHQLPSLDEVAAARGADCVVTLSSAVRTALVEDGLPADRSVVVEWGPDPTWQGYTAADARHGSVVLSTGRSGRDHTTLLAAATGLPDLRFVLHLPDRPRDGPACVDIRLPRADGRVLYSDLVPDFAAAAIAAVPLQPDRLVGLTELGDAMACGLPIVTTKTLWLDLDVDRIGCGITVDPGDVDGWRRALAALSADPDMRAEMGAAGRRYVDNGHNARAFGGRIAALLRDLAR
jgi:glycosyltransferase involved in cell wall biosynthesis